MKSATAKGRCLFTVGHSDYELSYFIGLLKCNGVTAIADVRSMPYSQANPQYNRPNLEKELLQNEIRYVFLGDELGARRSERQCYVDNRADYHLIAKLPTFHHGLDRIRRGLDQYRIALVCAEKDPLTCHRMILVCRHLRREDFDIWHILEDGCCESQKHAESRLLKSLDLESKGLFQPQDEVLEEAFDRQAEKIAFVERAGERVEQV
jgi:uncharacterized protein (DUF488 family)